MNSSPVSRRTFLRLGSVSLGAITLAACGTPSTSVPQLTTVAEDAPRAIVGDVLDFALKGDWPGRFGFVRFRLHAGFFDGERAYFIRTDASDRAFADAEKLVFVPKLSAAQRAQSATGILYLFDGGASDQLSVLSSVPSRENYSPLWHVHRVTVEGSTRYESEEQIKTAEAAGEVAVEPQELYVNYPVVKWPGGELSVDEAKEEYLGTGQLLEPVDTTNMTATFKLHECFPGSRYIVTDTSAAPMAPMMAVAASAPIQSLVGDGFDGTDQIWVFGNGIEGSGVMGFQPAIFAHRAGDPVWSPFWNHFTMVWKDSVTPRVLKSEDDILAALASGEVEQFNGTPDTHPTGFVVNCPVPVLAPNTFTG